MGKQAVEIRAAIFKTGPFALDTETHDRVLRSDAQSIEHCDEVGIGAVIENNESGVHCERSIWRFDIDRVRVTADVTAGFKNGNLVRMPQLIGGNQT